MAKHLFKSKQSPAPARKADSDTNVRTLSKAKGGEKEDDKEEDDDDEEDEDEEKSDLSEDELRKALTELGAIASQETPDARKQALMEKGLKGRLSKSENDELRTILGGGAREEPLADKVAKGLDPEADGNEDLAKAVDVSLYLDKTHAELTKSLRTLADRIEEGNKQQHEFNLTLAKALIASGNVTIDVKEAIEKALEQPVTAPRAAGLTGAKPLKKSLGNGDDASTQLTKAQTLSHLRGLYEEARKSNDSQARTVLMTEIAKYEQTQTLDPQVAAVIQARAAR